MKYHKVRFNLSRGENYMKWKVMYNNGWVRYYHPSEVQLVLRKCILKNSKATAMKIFTGVTTKVVCAWVLCQELEIFNVDLNAIVGDINYKTGVVTISPNIASEVFTVYVNPFYPDEIIAKDEVYLSLDITTTTPLPI